MNTTFPRLIKIVILALVISNSAKSQDSGHSKNIVFTNFTVTTDRQKIAIKWAFAKADSTNYFEIQKSIDGINFTTVALVLGPDPLQLSGERYGCFEKYIAKTAKHSVYRLKHIDLNGVEQLSETRMLAKS